MLTISGLFVYPIKSCQGVSLDDVIVRPYGLNHDRSFMIVDEHGQFITQRSHPQLTSIAVRLIEGGLSLQHPACGEQVVYTDQSTQTIVSVWQRQTAAYDQGQAVAEYLSDIVGQPVRLVYMCPSLAYSKGYQVLFQDAQPIHLVSESSLAHAQQQIAGAAIDYRRFRPNIVVSGAVDAFAEDDWQRITTCGVSMHVQMPCERCNVPAINPDSGEHEEAVLDYLRRYRLPEGRRVSIFGVTTRVTKLGRLRVGDVMNVRL
ncbi:MOSC domain-containing protein [Ostreibacterium oceani]|nr:MOSC N-terminal beta barrel domain-containing protein [Ostreibacterium oceani]